MGEGPKMRLNDLSTEEEIRWGLGVSGECGSLGRQMHFMPQESQPPDHGGNLAMGPSKASAMCQYLENRLENEAS